MDLYLNKRNPQLSNKHMKPRAAIFTLLLTNAKLPMLTDFERSSHLSRTIIQCAPNIHNYKYSNYCTFNYPLGLSYKLNLSFICTGATIADVFVKYLSDFAAFSLNLFDDFHLHSKNRSDICT